MSARLNMRAVHQAQTADALGLGNFGLQGFVLRCEGEWFTLLDPVPLKRKDFSCAWGAPGLWRPVPRGSGLVRLHDLPTMQASEATPVEVLSQMLRWAADTRAGRCPAGWTPPAREELETWVSAEQLSLRAGSVLTRGELLRAPDRLALVFPKLAQLPATFSPARRAWLDELLQDAQRRWHLVRFGLDPSTGCVGAEIDLTGVPANLARPMLQLALAALSRAVVWVLTSLSFLVDPSAQSVALDRHSPPVLKRSHPHV